MLQQAGGKMLSAFLHVLLLNKAQVGCCTQLTHEHDGKHAAVIKVGLNWVLHVTATTSAWLINKRKHDTCSQIHAAEVACTCNSS